MPNLPEPAAPERDRTRPRRGKLPPVHPGRVLLLDFMEPLGLTAYRVAKGIGVTPQHVGRIIHGQRGVSAEVALRLGRFLGTSADVWMNLQSRHDLDAADDAKGHEIERDVRPYDAA